MKLGLQKIYFKCDFKTILAPLFIVMKKAFVELCNNVSMTLLLGLGFISQAANFVRGVIIGETGVTVVTPLNFYIF